MRSYKHTYTTLLAFAVIIIGAVHMNSYACSRVVQISEDNSIVVIGRSMDWDKDPNSKLWFFPRGKERNGQVWGKKLIDNPLKWRARYKNVIISASSIGVPDGLNEKGFSAAALYLSDADYGSGPDSRPGIASVVLTQYLLDNFATVNEAVEELKKEKFRVVAKGILPSKGATAPLMHFAVSDASGDSAIIEYIKGKLRIHHGKKFNVTTNSPPYDKQLQLFGCWELLGKGKGKVKWLPGASTSIDRFVRASYYSRHMPDPKTSSQAIANMLAVMRNVSQPTGEYITRWRTVADSKKLDYYFESVMSPNVIWVNLTELNSSEYMMLNLNVDHVGNVSKLLVEKDPPF